MLVFPEFEDITRAQFAKALRKNSPDIFDLPEPPPGDGPIVIAEADHTKFRAAFLAAVHTNRDVFLADPLWGQSERDELAAILAAGPYAYLQDPNDQEPFGGVKPRGFSPNWGWLMIPTGGSRGKLKFARHDQETMVEAVRGFTRHLKIPRVHALGMLPLHHVSGFVAWMRAALTGGEYWWRDWKSLKQENFPELPALPDGWVTSVVPTQLDRLMHLPGGAPWLRKFRAVFVGGAGYSHALIDLGARCGITLSPCYGMTETAAMIAALKPEDFHIGHRSSGTLFKGVDLMIDPDTSAMSLWCPSLFRGYYGQREFTAIFETGDCGTMDFRGHLNIIGRRDFTINSGGEKVDPTEVENILRLGGLHHALVFGAPHPEWGEQVVACYPPGEYDWPRIHRLIRQYLAPYKRPKRLIELVDWPASSAGKVNRVRAKEMTLKIAADQLAEEKLMGIPNFQDPDLELPEAR